MPYPVAAARGKIQRVQPTSLYLLQDNFDTDVDDWTEGSPIVVWNGDNYHLASGSLRLSGGGLAYRSVVVPEGVNTVTVGFWAKGDAEFGDFYFKFGDLESSPIEYVTFSDANWNYYEADFLTSYGSFILFFTDAYNNPIYFDEVTIKIKN